MNSSFGLLFVVLIATLSTCTLALRCLEGIGSSDGSGELTKELECDSTTKHCVKVLAGTGIVYACDKEGVESRCASQGNACLDYEDHSMMITRCCCNSNLCNYNVSKTNVGNSGVTTSTLCNPSLCNSATLSKQHILTVIVAVIWTLISAR